MPPIWSRSPSRAWRVGVAGLGLLAIGCGGGSASVPGSVRVLSVTERDFGISAPKQLAAGDVVLRVRNRGPDGHELIVVRLDQASLPFRSDGLTVNEEAVQRREVGVLEPAATGEVRDLPLRLTPGRYVLFCNMSGHYLSGMHTTLVVK